MSEFSFFFTLFPILTLFLVGTIGLIFGSFISATSYRIPNQLSSLSPRSHCTTCKHTLSIRDLIPLLSWLCCKGTCRHCTNKIHWRYPLIELFTAFIFIITFLITGLSAESILLFLTVICLITMSIIDFEHRIIPNSTQQYLLLLAMLHWVLTGTPEFPDLVLGVALAASIGFGLRALWLKLRKKEVLGLGDAKFFLISGIFLGADIFPIFIFMTGALGIITGLIWKPLTNENEFPFAPALCTSLYICLLFPELQERLFQMIAELM